MIPEFETKKKRGDSANRRWGLGCLTLFMLAPLACCTLMVACFGLMFGLTVASENNEVTRQQSEVLEVARRESFRVEVSNPIGETVIRGGEVSTIQVELDLRASALTKHSAQTLLDRIELDIRREGDRYIVAIVVPETKPFSESQADLKITLPRELNLVVANQVGSVQVQGVTIRNELELVTNVGEITFQGALRASEGDYLIQTNIGEIQVKLDSGSQFQVEASSKVGEIESEWQLSPENRSQEGVGARLTGVYGESENVSAQLRIFTDVGRIKLLD